MTPVVAWSIVAATLSLAGVCIAFAFFSRPWFAGLTGCGLALLGGVVASANLKPQSEQGLFFMMTLFFLSGMAIAIVLRQWYKSQR